MTTTDLAFATVLFSSLRRMDAEATTLYPSGGQTGLHDYGKHARPDQKRPSTEPNWTKRLAVLLKDSGIPAKAEVKYPALPRCRCDLVVTLPTGRLWLEIKGAWKWWWLKTKGKDWIYRSYLLHPRVPGLDKTKTHTVPLDLKKLGTLTKKHADLVGELLVVFDSVEHPAQKEIDQLVQLAGLGNAPWTTASDAWQDSWRPGCSVSVLGVGEAGLTVTA